MFKKILYPTDFSDNSLQVVSYLKKLKDAGAKEIVVLHVMDIRYTGFIEPSFGMGDMPLPHFEADFYKTRMDEIKKKMASLKKRLVKDFKIKTLIREGVPFKEIIACAEKEKASLIAMGSHGKSNIEEMLLGSVTEKVVRKSQTPCLIVKRSKHK